MTHEHDVERSRQSVQRTVRLMVLVIAMLIGVVLACLRPLAAWPIAAMMGALAVSSLLVEYFNREGPNP